MTKEEHIRSLFGDSARIIKKDEDTMTLEIDLSSHETDGGPLDRPPLPPAQVQLAEEISAYLSAHMDRHTTIKELGEIFHASPTRIKNSVRNVYGMSVYALSKSQKMHAAARLLRHSDATVLDIAGRFGYDNGSKFARAFRDVIGTTPGKYRSEGRRD